MTKLKMLPMAVTMLGLGAGSAFAQIKLTDNLSLSGFLDMSISGEANDSDETLNSSFDQFELDFMYKFGDKISARADIAQGGLNGGAGTVALETGYVNYSSNGFGFSTGRFLSSSGFEAAEPTGLYQYSVSKTINYGTYQNGVNVSYGKEMFSLYGAVVADLWDMTETELMNSPGFEGQLALMPAAGTTIKATYLYQMYDEDATGDASKQLLNVWGSYAAGPLLVAAEYNMLIDWIVPDDDEGEVNDGMGNGWLVMANYKITDIVAATLRYSGIILGDADPDTEVTFSPSLALSPNWLTLAEIRYNIDEEKTLYAVESLFYF